MMIENLESRRLMSVSLDPASKLLTITGTDNADAITVKVVNGQLNVKDNAASKNFSLAAVQKLAIFARAGADQVTIDQNVLLPSTIDSGTGHPGGGQGDLDDELDPVDPAGVSDAERAGDEAADERGDDADADREPDGHVLPPRHDESPEGTNDGADDDGRDDHANHSCS